MKTAAVISGAHLRVYYINTVDSKVKLHRRNANVNEFSKDDTAANVYEWNSEGSEDLSVNYITGKERKCGSHGRRRNQSNQSKSNCTRESKN